MSTKISSNAKISVNEVSKPPAGARISKGPGRAPEILVYVNKGVSESRKGGSLTQGSDDTLKR